MHTSNTAKQKKQPPRWDSSPGVLSDFFPPKLPEPCPPPPVQANKSLAEKIIDLCQHYEVKCGGLEYESPASRYLYSLSRDVQSLTQGLVEEQHRMRESSAFYKELLKEWEEQFGLDSLFMFHEVPRLRLPLSLASTRPADLAKALAMLGEDKIQLESELSNLRKNKEHSLEELKRALDKHVVASRSSAEDMRQRFELSVRKTTEHQERRIQFLEKEAEMANKARKRQAQLVAQNHKYDIEKTNLHRQLQECTMEKEKLQQELETMRRERRFEIRRRNNISAERYQKQDHYDSLSMRYFQTETGPKSSAKRENENATDGGSSTLLRETQEQNKVMQDHMRNKDDIIESMRAIIKQLLETNTKCDNTQQQLHRGGRVVEPPYLAVGRVGIPQRQQQQPQPISTQKPQEGLARAKPMMEPFDLAPPKRTEFLLSKFPPGVPYGPATGPDAVFSIVTR